MQKDNQCAFGALKSNSSYITRAYTVKPVLSGNSKIYKTDILMTNGSLILIESIAECILQCFWPALSVIGLENQFVVFLRVAV